ncbi:MAG: MogA/MoaB family molybdenum cofactor biosynthesis protein [Anaerolineales bacterium]|jgi:molybdenum cofactor synthesis domain-containing protein
MRVSILTVSDRSSRSERADASGPLLREMMEKRGWVVVATDVVPDEKLQISGRLREWCDADGTDLVLTTGGTGLAPRDITPEATREVIEREAPGLAEAMRAAAVPNNPHAMLSRGIAGVRAKTLVVNLPGSPQGAREGLEVLLPALPHAVELIRGLPGAESGHGRLEG